MVLLLAALVAPARAATLDVIQHRWGFDGRAVPDRINLLSIEISNPSSMPFQGFLKLVRAAAVGQESGAELVAGCYLAPGQTKWVQFFPYIRRRNEAWTVEWGLGLEGRARLRGPTLGPPARVVLHDPADILSGEARFRAFPDGLFPTTVAATDGLHSVLIDHAPRWAPAQKQAFLDWLRRGGQAHILYGPNGRHPTFTGALAVLNAPLERLRVGAGLVVRHSLARAEVSEQTLTHKGLPQPKLRQSNQASIYNLEEELFRVLRSMTRPEHNWPLIYLSTIAYILLVGPVNYLFGRKRRDYRLTLLFFFATVAGFAYLLGFIGRRGHGEATAVHSIAYARQLDGAHYDVTQWVNAFVTRGATYEITHDAPHNLYSTCQEFEAVRGAIVNGKDGAFQVEIPLFSGRSFFHRGKLKGHPIKLKVAEWQGEERLQKLVLDYEAGFPLDAPEMWALHRDTFYPLCVRDGRIRLKAPSGWNTDSFLSNIGAGLESSSFGPGLYADADPGQKAPEQVFRGLASPLIGRAIGGTPAFYHFFGHSPFPKDRVQVFIFAKSPEAFRIQGRHFGKRMGYVLYHIDLFKPENPPTGLEPAGG
jgi:hypothetical protein